MTNEKFSDEFLRDAKSLVAQRNHVARKYRELKDQVKILSTQVSTQAASIQRLLEDNRQLRESNARISNAANRGVSPAIEELSLQLRAKDARIVTLEGDIVLLKAGVPRRNASPFPPAANDRVTTSEVPPSLVKFTELFSGALEPGTVQRAREIMERARRQDFLSGT